MAEAFLALGPVLFKSLEVPAKISFGGKQRTAVHRLADGSRVVDALGPDEPDIRFSGVFSGPDATNRALLLDSLRISGSVLPLRWDVFLYSVIISDFSADFRSGNWIPYQLSCAVLANESSAVSFRDDSLSDLISTDMATAASLGAVEGIDWQTAVRALRTSAVLLQDQQSRHSAVRCAEGILGALSARFRTSDIAISGFANAREGSKFSELTSPENS